MLLDASSIPILIVEKDKVPTLPFNYVRYSERAVLQDYTCGDCWAIATVQCFVDRLKRNRLHPPQDIDYKNMRNEADSCVWYKGSIGCNNSCRGGFLSVAHQHVVDDGVSGVKGKTFYRLTLYDDFYGIVNTHTQPDHKTPLELKTNADNIARDVFLRGPVATTFTVYSDFEDYWENGHSDDIYELGWRLSSTKRNEITPYGSTLWTKQSNPYGIYFSINHAVSIVGFGTNANGVQYWVCRNSWGSHKGPTSNGLFKIRRGSNMCGIESDVYGIAVKDETVTKVPPKRIGILFPVALAALLIIILIFVIMTDK